ncbi:16S rRNA (guanine(527)-N(7))-methyltransferase RsmG [Silanimonas algicola]
MTVSPTPAFDPFSLRAALERGLQALGLDPAAAVQRAAPVTGDDGTLAGALLAYLALLVRWNATYNLTAIRDPQEMLVKHLLDSLAMAPQVRGLANLADLGTGPGLPGLPLALATPGLAVALVESNGKKARFLRECVRQLGLSPRVRVLESRAEAVAEPGAFEAITARALDRLAGILAVGGHLLAPAGRLLAMKGVHPAGEIAELPAGWVVGPVHRLAVPGLEGERHLVEVRRG